MSDETPPKIWPPKPPPPRGPVWCGQTGKQLDPATLQPLEDEVGITGPCKPHRPRFFIW
jgi:hypothetical protein